MCSITMLEKYVGPFRASLQAVLRFAVFLCSEMDATFLVEGLNPNV